MSIVAAAAAQIQEALDALEEIRTHSDPAAVLDPPAVVLGPPTLTWLTGCVEPNEAVFPVIVVVRADSRAMDNLWDIVPKVVDALDSLPNVQVNNAMPRTWGVGDKEFPAYEVPASVALPL
jgi:hypothetical protein